MKTYKYKFIKKMSVLSLAGILIGMSLTACKSTSESTETNTENTAAGEGGNANATNPEQNGENGNSSVNGESAGENQTSLNNADPAAPSDAPINSNGLNGAINNGADGAAAGNAVAMEDPATAPVPPNTMAGGVAQDPFAPPGAPSSADGAIPPEGAPDPAQIAAAPNVTVPEPPTNQSGNPPVATEGQESGNVAMAVPPPEGSPEGAPVGEQGAAEASISGETPPTNAVAQSNGAASAGAENAETDGPPTGSTGKSESRNQIAGVLPEDGTTMAYHIQTGDTLATIAQAIYGNKNQWKKLASENNLSDPNKIYVGDVIYYKLTGAARSFAEHYEGIPKKSVVVKKGDTLSQIAKNTLGSEGYWRTLWKMNPSIKNPDRIRPGTTIIYSAHQGAHVSYEEQDTMTAPARTVAQNYMDLP